MDNNTKKKGKFRQKLVHKYRMVILNEDTFEEKISFKLTRLNVFIFGGLFSIFLIVATIFLIAFTQLREYIPGYSSTKLQRQATELVYKTDSLEEVIKVNEAYLDEIRALLVGKVTDVNFDKDSVLATIQYDKDTMRLMPSDADLEFRTMVEEEDRYSLFNEAQIDSDIVFFSPVDGTISEPYSIENNHLAVDIATEMGTPVKSVADGTVLFAEWTAETGHVIIVEHSQGFISIYKHNSSLHKVQGDLVVSGEVIASAGNTGEFSTGPHLHFELWNQGYAVNPTNYIDFE